MSVAKLPFNATHVFDGSVDAIDREMTEASVDKIIVELPNLPPLTLDRVVLAGHRVHEGICGERDGIVCSGVADADVVVVWKNTAQFVVESSAETGHIECVAQLERYLYVGVVAVAIPNIACRNAQNRGGPNEFDGQIQAIGNFDAHVGVALRDAVERKEAAIAACRAYRAAVNEFRSRAADGERRNRRVGRRSCGDDWHRACCPEKKMQDESRKGRSSGSDDCANALRDRDAQRRLHACEGAAHGGIRAHANLVTFVGPCSVGAYRRIDKDLFDAML
eukprot:1067824-Pleurochrysis_carterae.AAC.4